MTHRQANMVIDREVFELPLGTHMAIIEDISDNYMCFRISPNKVFKTYSSHDGYAAKKLTAMLKSFGRHFEESTSMNELSVFAQDHIGEAIFVEVWTQKEYPDIHDFKSINARL